MPMTPKGRATSLSFDFEASLQASLASAAAKADKKNLIQAPREEVTWDDSPQAVHNVSAKRYRVHANKPAVPLTPEDFPPMPVTAIQKRKTKSPNHIVRHPGRNDEFLGKRKSILDYLALHPLETPGQIAKALSLEGPYVRTVLLRAKHRKA